MGHTPGPWTVGHTRQSKTHPSIGPFYETAVHVGDSTARGNCLAIAYMGGDGATDKDRDAVEANARLIAAAPDLLEAIQKLLWQHEQELKNEYCGSLLTQMLAQVDHARAAIAKATGDE